MKNLEIQMVIDYLNEKISITENRLDETIKNEEYHLSSINHSKLITLKDIKSFIEKDYKLN